MESRIQSLARKCRACHADYPLNPPAHPFCECQIKPPVELERTESCLYIGDENDQRNSGEVVDIRDYECRSAPAIHSITKKTTVSTAHTMARSANGLTHIKVYAALARLSSRASSSGKSAGVSTNQSFNQYTAVVPFRGLSALFHAVAHHLTEVIERLGLPLFLVVPERPAVAGGRTLDLGASSSLSLLRSRTKSQSLL